MIMAAQKINAYRNQSVSYYYGYRLRLLLP